MDKLTLQDFQEVDERFGNDVFSCFDYEVSVERRNGVGGPAKKRVEEQIRNLMEALK